MYTWNLLLYRCATDVYKLSTFCEQVEIIKSFKTHTLFRIEDVKNDELKSLTVSSEFETS